MEIIKKIINVLLCVSMILASASSVYAQPITLKVNGLLKDFINQPISENDVLHLDGKELAQIIGADSKWDANLKTLTIIKGTKVAVFKVDNTAYTFNEKTKYLNTKAVQSTDSLLLPIRTVCDDFGLKVNWSSDDQLLQINMDDNLITFLNTNEAIDTSTQIITFDEALKMAIQINSTIKTLNENIDYMEKNRKAMLNDYFKYQISGEMLPL